MPIREDLEAVEREFARHVQSQVALIPTMGKYIQSSGGKRIRPAVLLMAARMSGYTGEHGALYASVVEFIHTATLVHDDIIDASELRRGRQAVHSRWGNDVTVLLGDFLYIKSMSLALTARLEAGESPIVEASLFKDLGTSFEQAVADRIAEDVGRRPEDPIDPDLSRALDYVSAISPS